MPFHRNEVFGVCFGQCGSQEEDLVKVQEGSDDPMSCGLSCGFGMTQERGRL